MTTLVKILFEKNRVIAVGRLLKIVAGRLLCATIARNGNARGYARRASPLIFSQANN